MDKDKDKLRILRGKNQPSELKELLRRQVEYLPDLLEYFPVYAKMIRIKYKALLAQGFTKEEALELCKTLI